MSEADHELVSSAVHEAEQSTDGEIVTIVADLSDDYRETAYVWASLSALLVLAAFALFPDFYTALAASFYGEWNHRFSNAEFLVLAGTAALVKWLAVWFILHWQPLRLLLTLPYVKRNQVRLRAVDLFRVGTESRTMGRTGVLIFLSMKEHRAEIIADKAIADKVAPEIWGDAMIALIDHTKNGQPGAGMADAVRQVGIVLTEYFPKTEANPNELPDRLIEL
ncbi:MAG: hypothetical protein HC843_07665 [Sphingomonadales bacterium]|nr:hypothetical protein [Sphingomonadales bacterium]